MRKLNIKTPPLPNMKEPMTLGSQALKLKKPSVRGASPKTRSVKPKMKLLPSIRGLGGL